jgi:hypothetical protein
MDTERLKKFAGLTAQKRNAKKVLESLDAEITQLQEEILDEMCREGISQARVDTDDGRFTLYPTKQLWAKAHEGNYDLACKFLKKIGLGDLVEKRFNTNRLSAVIREWDAQETPLPKGIEKYIDIAETYKIGVRRANGE